MTAVADGMDREKELPEGWARCVLNDVLQANGLFDGPFGSSLKTADYVAAGVRVIRLENLANLTFIDSKRTYITREKYKSLTRHTVGAGDVLFGSFIDGSVRVCILPKLDTLAIAKADCFCIRPNDGIVDRRFLVYQLARDETRDALVEQIHGATRPRVTTKQVKAARILLAPLAEQRRIVEKVEALLARVESARERLTRASAILKRFRQSVLAAACSGELTEGWREKTKCLQPWQQTTLGALLTEIRYGTSKKCVFEPKWTPVLRIPNVIDGRVNHDDLKFAQFEDSERTKLALAAGDILMIRSNGSLGLVGRTALVTEREIDFAYAGYLIRLRLSPSLARPGFVSLSLASPDCRDAIELVARSTSGVNNINTDEIKALPISLPDFDEQDAIVQRVDALMSSANTIERRIAASLVRAEKLPQSILAKAFAGELVPTEAELSREDGRGYEPAAALLARFTEAARSERYVVSPKPETER